MALGTVEITILTILDMLKKLKEFPIFLIPFIGIPGKNPGYSPDHQTIGDQKKDQTEGKSSYKAGQEAGNQSTCQNYHAETIRSIAAGHKSLHGIAHIHNKTMKPRS